MCKNCSNTEYHPVNKERSPSTINYEAAAGLFRLYLEALGFDLKDPNMRDTPDRVTKMYVDELFSGLFTPKPKVTLFDLEASQSPSTGEVIVVGPIPFKSMCSHHLMPIRGSVYIGVYLDKRVYPGLSKYARIVEWYARRPQIQEQFTQQVHDHIFNALEMGTSSSCGLIVVCKAEHGCMSHRGVNVDSKMITSSLSGTFKNPTMRQEFFSLINIKD